MFTCPLPLNKGQDRAKTGDKPENYVKNTTRREGYVPR